MLAAGLPPNPRGGIAECPGCPAGGYKDYKAEGWLCILRADSQPLLGMKNRDMGRTKRKLPSVLTVFLFMPVVSSYWVISNIIRIT